jgi:AmmeMemoRadiSam system protein A
MSPQSDNPDRSHTANTEPDLHDVHCPDLKAHAANEFNLQERKQLLTLAHEAILSVVEHRETPLIPPSPRFASPRGAFTTIYLHGNLRGCVGYALPTAPLYRTIIETARGAAFEDSRFPALTLDEIPEVEVSLSILSSLKIVRPEEVEIGTHGLLISRDGHRGLLLPQVPLEHGWDRTAFLEQTCRKGGLPSDAWQSAAKIEIFTAEVFGDSDLR